MAKYVQICNGCGHKYFMDDPAERKSVCDECGKRSIRLVAPLLLPEEGSGSGTVPSEGGTDWKEMMRRHRERLQQQKKDGMTGETKDGKPKDGKPAERQSGPLCMKVSGLPGNLALRLDDSKGPVFIGRGWTQGQYFEQDKRVSWIHCVFFCKADGKWYVRDMQSSNGTFLCEQAGASEIRVSAYEPAALAKGSIIRLGQWDDAIRLEVTEA